MPPGKKAGGRDFKIGNPGGPGRRKLPSEIRALREELSEEFFRALVKCGNMNTPSLQSFIQSAEELSFVKLAGVCWARALGGNSQHIDLLLNRLIGPAPKPVEISGPDGRPLEVRQFADCSDEQLERGWRVIEELLKEADCKSTQTSQPLSGSQVP